LKTEREIMSKTTNKCIWTDDSSNITVGCKTNFIVPDDIEDNYLKGILNYCPYCAKKIDGQCAGETERGK